MINHYKREGDREKVCLMLNISQNSKAYRKLAQNKYDEYNKIQRNVTLFCN